MAGDVLHRPIEGINDWSSLPSLDLFTVPKILGLKGLYLSVAFFELFLLEEIKKGLVTF